MEILGYRVLLVLGVHTWSSGPQSWVTLYSDAGHRNGKTGLVSYPDSVSYANWLVDFGRQLASPSLSFLK